MTELPAGTVTFVFTDIEGSTRLLASLGSQYEAVLEDHRKLLRDAFSSHHGVEVDTQGDAFFYAFAKAHDALAGALAAQRALASHPWPDDTPLSVRMGIHTGEPTVSSEGYVGGDVHLGARICAAAWGEQILVSDATARLLAANQDASLRDLGEFSLKDIEVPVRLHQVIARDVRADFPPPRTAPTHPTNLPPTLEPLVGRAEDISELTSLLISTEVRVVTLTGPGGVGKTRLSLATGVELLPSFPDGVFFVDLSALSDPALVTGAIAGALGLRESAGRSLSDTLSDYLASRQMLLILDNLEHLLAATPDISVLLTSAPSLKVLVTSREPLRIAGEHEVPLAPLGLPVSDADATEVATSPAVQLFIGRAQALRADFEVTADEAPSVAAICRRLDGLPLAIELAAARTKVLSLPALASRLDQSLAALGQGRRDASARQRTLRGAIEWSYDLLTPAEQTLLRRLAVFAGGFTLEAAEAVCDRDDLSIDVLDGLASLIDKSLVRAREQEDRFVMLETIRSFAADELEESGEAEEITRAHADFFRSLAEYSDEALTGPRQGIVAMRLGSERENFRAVLGWSLEHAPEVGLRLASALSRYWWRAGVSGEGRMWLENVLAVSDGPTPFTAQALRGLARIAQMQGDHIAARSAADRGIALYSDLGNDVGVAQCLETLAVLAEEEGNYADADAYTERIRAIYVDAGHVRGVSAALGNLANIALLEDDFDRAYSLAEQSLEMDKRLRDAEGAAVSLLNMALAALENARLDDASDLFRRSLEYALEANSKRVVVSVADGLAARLVSDDPEESVCLLGAVDQTRMLSGATREALDQRLYERTITGVRARLGDAELHRLMEVGRQQPLETALRNWLDSGNTNTTRPSGSGPDVDAWSSLRDASEP
jgi:predicted ATPase/class 3 adenylate cyclase